MFAATGGLESLSHVFCGEGWAPDFAWPVFSSRVKGGGKNGLSLVWRGKKDGKKEEKKRKASLFPTRGGVGKQFTF